jgi:hypothetical protein
MRFDRPQRLFTAWMAALAVVWAGLAPAALHARGDQHDDTLIEVCTAGGTKWVPSDGAHAGDPSPAVEHAIEHCSYCSIHTNGIAMAPSDMPPIEAPGLVHERPEALLDAPHTPPAWSGAQARAPPALL